MFLMWTGTKQELLVFLETLKSKHKTIKFEHNISHNNISFLETLIYKVKSNSSDNPLPKTH